MKVSEIKNSISALSGIGPKISKLFARLNVFTAGDLMQFYPRGYEDRTKKITLDMALSFPKVHTIAKVIGYEWFGFGRMRTLKVLINDGTANAELVAFNRPFLEKTLPKGAIISVTGRFTIKYGKLQSSSFEAEKIAEDGDISEWKNSLPPESRIIPIYRLTEGLSQKAVQKAVKEALRQFSGGIEDELPNYLIIQHKLLHKKDAIRQIHCPQTFQDYEAARKSLVYEEFFFFQCAIARQSINHRGKLPQLEINANTPDNTEDILGKKQRTQEIEEIFTSSLSPRQKQYLARLPFSPTTDQKKVIIQINIDIDKSYESSSTAEKGGRAFSMRALLQGDVGSGKTLVSFFAALRVIDYGSQVAFMAPTEILARQHADKAASELESLDVKVAYLTGNINAKGRINLLSALKDGTINLVIGTHALFTKNVQYKDMSLAIIDEQHRFGVMQRAAIIDKGRTSSTPKVLEPNLLMMSATPIPQTLALTAFGDLDILTIRTMPQGRKPIITYLTKAGNEHNAYEAVRKELLSGHQAYFVYPAIGGNEDDYHGEFISSNLPLSYFQDNDDWQKESIKSAEASFCFLQTKVYPEFKCALIHSKVEEETQNQILNDFRIGKIQVLVATTVVEVGVDVPNATCMVIEQADRFGLAALHQLRGRVGRGDAQSYCFLIYRKNITENGIARMKAIRQTTDGFKIAEEDLKLRGPGEITGTVQSGELSFALADLFKDQQIMNTARTDAFKYVASQMHL